MSTAITGDLIVLNLQNLSSVDSEVNLFSYTSPNSPNSIVDTGYVATIVYGIHMFINGFRPSGTSFGQFITSTDVNDLVNQLNTNSVAWFEVQCTFAIDGSKLIVTNTQGAIFTSIADADTLIPYFFTNYEVISGSTVNVGTVGSGLTYSELVSELVAQPYLIESLNVYANTLSQVGVRWKKAKRETNGTSFIDFDMPRVDPMQTQFAIEGIQLNYTPSPINYLNYRVKGNQSVRLFFYYKYKGKLELNLRPQNKQIELNTSVIEKPTITKNMKENIKLPLFELVKPIQQKKISIKEKLSSKVVTKDVTHEEIYTAFDGLDFKQH